MAYLGNFTSGQVLTAAELNQLNAACYLSASSAVSCATGANTTLTFAAGDVVIDPASWFVDATDRITPLIAGVYVCGMAVQWAANAGAIAYATVLKNGATVVTKNTSNLATAGANSSIQTMGLISMNGSTDYLNAVCYQSSGGAVNAGARQFFAYLLRKT